MGIQDLGRMANVDTVEDLNQPDLEEEKEGVGEVGGVMESVEDEGVDGEEPVKDSHEDLRDVEVEFDAIEGGG